MQIMNKTTNQDNQLFLLESHLCGLMIVLTFFGEHFKLFGFSLYCYPIIPCIFLLLANNNFKVQIIRRINFSRIETFPILLIIFSTFTLPFSFGSVGTQPYFKTVVTALIMLLVANNIYDEKSLELVMRYALIGVIITAVACGYELYTGHHFYTRALTDERLFRMGKNNSFGFQINVNDNASLMALSVFIVIIYLKGKSFISKVFLEFLAFVLLMITSAIGSRLVFLTLIVVSIEAVILLLISRYTKGKVPRFIIGALIVIICGFYLILFNVTGFLNSVSSAAYYNQDYARVHYMQWSLKTITPLSLLFGHGCGVTQQLIGGYSIHSVLVEFLCDNGIIVASYLINLIIQIQFSFSDKINRIYGNFLSCFATAFVFISFCSSSMLRIRSVWVYLVIMWKLYSLQLSQSDSDGGYIEA